MISMLNYFRNLLKTIVNIRWGLNEVAARLSTIENLLSATYGELTIMSEKLDQKIQAIADALVTLGTNIETEFAEVKAQINEDRVTEEQLTKMDNLISVITTINADVLKQNPDVINEQPAPPAEGEEPTA